MSKNPWSSSVPNSVAMERPAPEALKTIVPDPRASHLTSRRLSSAWGCQPNAPTVILTLAVKLHSAPRPSEMTLVRIEADLRHNSTPHLPKICLGLRSDLPCNLSCVAVSHKTCIGGPQPKMCPHKSADQAGQIRRRARGRHSTRSSCPPACAPAFTSRPLPSSLPTWCRRKQLKGAEEPKLSSRRTTLSQNGHGYLLYARAMALVLCSAPAPVAGTCRPPWPYCAWAPDPPVMWLYIHTGLPATPDGPTAADHEHQKSKS